MAFTPQYDAWAGPLPMEIGWIRNVGGTDANIAKHKNAGFDFVIAVTASVSDLDRIEAAGVWAITAHTSAKANHAAVRGWYIADEPDSAEGSPSEVTMPSTTTSSANSVRAADTRNLPLFLGLGEGFVCGQTETTAAGWGSLGRGSRWNEPTHGDGDYVDYVDGGDFEWISTFNYAVAGNPLQPKFRQVAGGLTQTPTEIGLRQPNNLASVPNGRKRGYRLVPSLRGRKFWQTIEATKYHSDFGLKPTYQQLRYMALSSVINGAPGVIWFDVGFGTVTTEALLSDAAQLALVTNVNAELHSLEAVLNASAPVTNGVTVAADGPIDTLVKIKDGQRHLFAANMSNAVVHARFEFPGSSDVSELDLDPYAIHIYAVDEDSVAGAAADQIVHLLRRTEYVARPERVAALTVGSYAAAVDDIVNVPAGEVPIPAGLEVHDADNIWDQYTQAVQWWFERMARTSMRPIQEKMAFFWHGHFCSEWGKVSDTGAMMQQNKLFRDGGLGNVRVLTQAMAIQPAMLRYLDNAQNSQSAPNQNFGRELLELFLLGVGNYTEDDVEAATSAWTGHGVDSDNQYEFHPGEHDSTVRSFLGQPVSNGPDVIDVVLGPTATIAVGPNAGMLSKVVAARFLSKKLWEAFAYEAPSATIVNALGDALVNADFAIKPWVKAMLKRPEFLSTTARQGLVKSPVEYIAGLLYHTGIAASVAQPEFFARDMGQAMFLPPNASGWKINGCWINARASAARASFAGTLRATLQSNRTPSTMFTLRADSWTWAGLDAMESPAFIDTLAAGFDLQLSDATRNALIAWSEAEKTPGGQRWSRSSNGPLLAMIAPEMNVA